MLNDPLEPSLPNRGTFATWDVFNVPRSPADRSSGTLSRSHHPGRDDLREPVRVATELISVTSPSRTVNAMTVTGRSSNEDQHPGGPADGDRPQDRAGRRSGSGRSGLGGDLARRP